eukprot:TRINITY_DN2734_c1_g1_i1.p1 TRINITY_DN2734_c1_g1~~TRINITY_DN2734_c1_g1_i1.p1  ORF type:complete len:1209 (-),score=217.29 TRINITY_DN2734_c1_g1_i1:1358-4984(-)
MMHTSRMHFDLLDRYSWREGDDSENETTLARLQKHIGLFQKELRLIKSQLPVFLQDIPTEDILSKLYPLFNKDDWDKMENAGPSKKQYNGDVYHGRDGENWDSIQTFIKHKKKAVAKSLQRTVPSAGPTVKDTPSRVRLLDSKDSSIYGLSPFSRQDNIVSCNTCHRTIRAPFFHAHSATCSDAASGKQKKRPNLQNKQDQKAVKKFKVVSKESPEEQAVAAPQTLPDSNPIAPPQKTKEAVNMRLVEYVAEIKSKGKAEDNIDGENVADDIIDSWMIFSDFDESSFKINHPQENDESPESTLDMKQSEPSSPNAVESRILGWKRETPSKHTSHFFHSMYNDPNPDQYPIMSGNSQQDDSLRSSDGYDGTTESPSLHSFSRTYQSDQLNSLVYVEENPDNSNDLGLCIPPQDEYSPDTRYPIDSHKTASSSVYSRPSISPSESATNQVFSVFSSVDHAPSSDTRKTGTQTQVQSDQATKPPKSTPHNLGDDVVTINGKICTIIDVIGLMKQYGFLTNSKHSASNPHKKINLAMMCGVLVDGNPCTRSFNCKAHVISAKRQVSGRPAPFDELIALQKLRNHPKILETLNQNVIYSPTSSGKSTGIEPLFELSKMSNSIFKVPVSTPNLEPQASPRVLTPAQPSTPQPPMPSIPSETNKEHNRITHLHLPEPVVLVDSPPKLVPLAKKLFRNRSVGRLQSLFLLSEHAQDADWITQLQTFSKHLVVPYGANPNVAIEPIPGFIPPRGTSLASTLSPDSSRPLSPFTDPATTFTESRGRFSFHSRHSLDESTKSPILRSSSSPHVSHQHTRDTQALPDPLLANPLFDFFLDDTYAGTPQPVDFTHLGLRQSPTRDREDVSSAPSQEGTIPTAQTSPTEIGPIQIDGDPAKHYMDSYFVANVHTKPTFQNPTNEATVRAVFPLIDEKMGFRPPNPRGLITTAPGHANFIQSAVVPVSAANPRYGVVARCSPSLNQHSRMEIDASQTQAIHVQSQDAANADGMIPHSKISVGPPNQGKQLSMVYPTNDSSVPKPTYFAIQMSQHGAHAIPVVAGPSPMAVPVNIAAAQAAQAMMPTGSQMQLPQQQMHGIHAQPHQVGALYQTRPRSASSIPATRLHAISPHQLRQIQQYQQLRQQEQIQQQMQQLQSLQQMQGIQNRPTVPRNASPAIEIRRTLSQSSLSSLVRQVLNDIAEGDLYRSGSLLSSLIAFLCDF